MSRTYFSGIQYFRIQFSGDTIFLTAIRINTETPESGRTSAMFVKLLKSLFLLMVYK